MKRELPAASITINGTPLTSEQSEALYVALLFARSDILSDRSDLIAVGLLSRVDDMIEMIDNTEVRL